MADSYPVLFRDDFASGSDLNATNWETVLTGSAPTTSIAGGTLTMDAANSTNANSRKVKRLTAATGTGVKNKRVRCAYQIGTPSTQFLTFWTAINDSVSPGSTITGGITLTRGTTAWNLQRRRAITTSNTPTADLLDTDATAISAGTDIILEIDDIQVVAATSSKYLARVRALSDESLLFPALDSGTVNSSTSDTAAYRPGLSIQTSSALIYWYEVLDIAAPNITSHPSATASATGATGSFAVTATGGDAGTTPGTTTNITYQWQVDSGSGFANVSGGTGATTNSYTTPTLLIGDNGKLYRCVVTDSGNSHVHNSNSALLTVSSSAGPIFQSATTATDGSYIDVTFNKALTLNSSSIARWAVAKNGGTAVTIASVAINSTSKIRLTLTGRIKASDTSVVVSFDGTANVLEDSGGNDAEAFTGNAVTNASNVDFVVAVNAPYNVSRIRKGRGRCKIRVDIERTNHTASITLGCTGVPANVTATVTNPGTGNVGYVEFTSTSGASVNLSGATITITATDAVSDARTGTTTLYVHSATRQADYWAAPIFGSSTVNYLRLDGAIDDLGDIFDAPNAWTYTALLDDDGEFGVASSFTADWTVAGDVSTITNAGLHRLLVWAIQHDAYEVMGIWPYSNDASFGTVWAGISASVQTSLQYLADNFDAVLICPAHGRYDAAATASGTVTAGGVGTTYTLNVTVGNLTGKVGDYLVIPNSTEFMAREITGVSGNDVTFDRAFPVNVANATAFTIVPDTINDNLAAMNVGIQTFCEGGVSAITGTGGGRTLFGETGAFAAEQDKIRGDNKIHSAASFAPIHVGYIRDLVLAPYLLEDATLALSPSTATVTDGDTRQFTRVFTGYAPFGGAAYPGGLTGGTWSVDLGSVDSDGLYSADAGAGSATIEFETSLSARGGTQLSDTSAITVSAQVETVPPTITTPATASGGTTTVIPFSETVLYPSPLALHWEIAADGQGLAISNAAFNSNQVTLTHALIYDGNTDVRLAYVGGANVIEDLAGNDLAQITNVAVANNSTQPGPTPDPPPVDPDPSGVEGLGSLLTRGGNILSRLPRGD